MERLVDKIRKEYPCPITLDEAMRRNYSVPFGGDNIYCVNVAGYRWWCKNRPNEYYPGEGRTDIVAANNSGNFELAWELLGQALENYEVPR